MNRRRFLLQSLAGAGALSFPHVAAPTIQGANDRIRLGFIGLGGRARWMIQNEAFPGAEIIAVADCWMPRCHEAAMLKPEGPGENRYHIQNFLECVRTRNKPTADVEIGHRSNSVCHLVNICRDVGRKLQWDPQTERFAGDEQANSLLRRPRRKGYELPRTG